MEKQVNYQQLNGAALAYLGDAVYEQAIRHYILTTGHTNPNQLHKSAVKFVGAKGQARIIKHWIDQDNVLTDEEIAVYKRGRNHKANTKAKNASIQDYRQATGFEALIGWLYLSGKTDRLELLIEEGIQLIEGENNNEQTS
ncbi:Mini-ribonuclease 3 [Aerococcaceae bacterium DSM 111176]|nr:Mini-ribonuclease 3 [Aerococcaceae bacterium DSM 111176]